MIKTKKLLTAMLIVASGGFAIAQSNDVNAKKIEEFKPIAKEYNALAVKPQLPEEARKYIVQATNATEEKRYNDAITLYEKAIKVDQTYPQAHYNLALILGTAEQYNEAIVEMTKYLLLVPDAKDARASQDQIYAWEGKAEAVNKEKETIETKPKPKRRK